MNKNKLITKQQLKIQKLKKIKSKNAILIKKIEGHFIAVGQPLNDNVLKFNPKQLQWAQNVYDLIKEIL